MKKIETDNLTMFNDYGNGPGYSTAENFGQYSRVERSNTNHNLKIDTCFTTVYQNLPISGLPLRATLGPSSVSYMNKYESSEPETFKEASEGKQKPTNSVFVKDKYSTLYEELA